MRTVGKGSASSPPVPAQRWASHSTSRLPTAAPPAQASPRTPEKSAARPSRRTVRRPLGPRPHGADAGSIMSPAVSRCHQGAREEIGWTKTYGTSTAPSVRTRRALPRVALAAGERGEGEAMRTSDRTNVGPTVLLACRAQQPGRSSALERTGCQWTPQVVPYPPVMRVTVAELAKAQGFRDDFDSLQRLRRGQGVTGPGDLSDVTDYVKRHVLNIENDSDSQLQQGLDTLRRLIEKSPPHERELLKLNFNLDSAFGRFNWLERVENLALDHDGGGSSRSIRHQADLALLQLLMRTRPAAEADPVPDSEPFAETASGQASSALGLFAENYVHNSHRFARSWESARTVDMCGFGHNRMAVTYSDEMGRIIRTGGQVRVLMQNPEGQAVLAANRRSSTPKASADAVRHQHRSAIATFDAIRAAASGTSESLQVRAYDVMPPFTGYFFDPDDQTAAHAYIWFWSWRQPSAWRPGFVVTQASDPLWYGRFRSQFDVMWADEDTHAIPEEGSP